MPMNSDSEEEYTNEEHVKPTAFLFEQEVIGINEIRAAEKYIIMSAFHPIADSYKLTLGEVEAELKKLDFLTFDWGLIPKQVFKDIFDHFTYVRLVHFCAHFHIHLDMIRESQKPKMIDALWEHFDK